MVGGVQATMGELTATAASIAVSVASATLHLTLRRKSRPRCSSRWRLLGSSSHSMVPQARRMTSLYSSLLPGGHANGGSRAFHTGKLDTSVVILMPTSGLQEPSSVKEPTRATVSPHFVHSTVASKLRLMVAFPVRVGTPLCASLKTLCNSWKDVFESVRRGDDGE